MDLQLQNKTALVTGSTAGIGLATAKLLASEGASVIITGRTEDRINAAIDLIKQNYTQAKVSGFRVDFSNVADIEKLTKHVPEVDILINNVGIFEPKPFAGISDIEWFNFFEINVLSGVRLSRFYFSKMLEKNWGRIIF